MIIQYIKIVMNISLALYMMATSTQNFEDNAEHSLADQLHLSRSKDPVDGGWLPDLSGLPDQKQIALLTEHVRDVMREETDKRCTAINWRLRMMIFQHFVIYQHMANMQHVYFDDKIAYQWAHVLGMILKESSGDTTSITDMRGHSLSTYQSGANLRHWKQILNLTEQGRVKLNYQTNFGLTQTSADRLFVAFRLAQNQKYDTEFLEGIEGAETPRKLALNTAIAIRRLIWFYQDFAQGRIEQFGWRTHKQDIKQFERSHHYQTALKMALLYCGTCFMFSEEECDIEKDKIFKLKNAMASIAYCKLGNSQAGYGMNEFDEKCFAQWVTLCPALNIDIATLTPLSYFATRAQKPVCEDTFKRLLNERPESELINWLMRVTTHDNFDLIKRGLLVR